MHSTPYESKEGGYQYIWGGPYEADEVIRDVFANVASNEIIDGAIEAIERKGLEWVPNERRRQPPEDWVDLVIPDDPHSIFMDSYHQSGSILADHGGEDGSTLINRMVFAQQVSALEAYLGDTLLNAIREKTEPMMRLLAADKELNAEKFTLADIASNPDIAVLVHSIPMNAVVAICDRLKQFGVVRLFSEYPHAERRSVEKVNFR